ncbi:hypothetical protein D3C81_1992170 [compost metagenome]
MLQTMDQARRALSHEGEDDVGDARLQLLHALSGLRLALLPGVEIVAPAADAQDQIPHGIDGAPL